VAEPVKLNSNLGYYTNFMNLLDLAAIAVPAGYLGDGLPFGVTLVAPAFNDETLCGLGDIAHRAAVKTMGATGLPLPTENPRESLDPNLIQVAVCGAHMSGLPLNHQLTERGARLLAKSRTASSYRLFALTDFNPPRPGLVRDPEGGTASGSAIEVEIWEVPASAFGGFVDAIPAPLGIGTLTLENGRQVKGFLCEAHATKGAREITSLGSWRQFIKGG
jgi:allophanate hydrolase